MRCCSSDWRIEPDAIMLHLVLMSLGRAALVVASLAPANFHACFLCPNCDAHLVAAGSPSPPATPPSPVCSCSPRGVWTTDCWLLQRTSGTAGQRQATPTFGREGTLFCRLGREWKGGEAEDRDEGDVGTSKMAARVFIPKGLSVFSEGQRASSSPPPRAPTDCCCLSLFLDVPSDEQTSLRFF